MFLHKCKTWSRSGKDVPCAYVEGATGRKQFASYVVISTDVLVRCVFIVLKRKKERWPSLCTHRQTSRDEQAADSRAFFVSHQVQAAMFSQAKITGRGCCTRQSPRP